MFFILVSLLRFVLLVEFVEQALGGFDHVCDASGADFNLLSAATSVRKRFSSASMVVKRVSKWQANPQTAHNTYWSMKAQNLAP